jgi:ABC-type branched-subunit amino acid transport system ATPase component
MSWVLKADHVLDVRGLTKKFGGLTAVDDCSFQVAQREIFGVIGPNGSGKSTLFNMITGMVPPDRGSVAFDERSMTGLKPYRLARRGVGRTFQIPRVFGGLTVRENVDLTASLFRVASTRPPEFYLDHFGLTALGSVLAQDLSHGQQKLLEFAILASMESKLILLDEPTAGVNPKLIGKMVEIIREFREWGATVLLVEHTLRVVDSICDRVLVLDQGRKVVEGTPAELKADARVRQAYYLL